MNQIYRLSGTLTQLKNHNRGGERKLPPGKSVTLQHVLDLKAQLDVIHARWAKDKTIGGVLFSAHYIRVIAKSNRIKCIFKEPEKTICGARFEETDGSRFHVFTYFMSLDELDDAVRCMDESCRILQGLNASEITAGDMERLRISYGSRTAWLPWSRFNGIVTDSYFVSHFSIDEAKDEIAGTSMVSFYKTKADMWELLRQAGLFPFAMDRLDDWTFILSPDQYNILKEKYPYLIAMSVTDLTGLCPEKTLSQPPLYGATIPSPKDEPVIGVIDTFFSDKVYFHEWVEFTNMLDPSIPVAKDDYVHGTEIDSIIVDGPTLNPRLDDHCGRFRVRHFAVGTNSFSSFSIVKSLRRIISGNRDIKVWNLSLGSETETERNFISPVAAELDSLQMKYDVIFIVSGTNKPADSDSMRIGSPADSINSIVVNSVNRHNEPASYSREGPVLSFYQKPDVSYYGGDLSTGINVCSPDGILSMAGTSFAAPWITRKVAYLIYYLGLTREVAKALIIDSAIGWKPKETVSTATGYGVVPVHIEDIVQSENDEIKFFICDRTREYEASAYNIPIPVVDNKYPFIARATLCYFTDCNRYNGVDYTGEEMDLKFGRVKLNDTAAGKVPEIVPIDRNSQDTGDSYVYEDEARSMYRKWDNVKYIREIQKSSHRAKKHYDGGQWGIDIKTKERTPGPVRTICTFGLVITLKEITGRNRINEFINLCRASNWVITPIDARAYMDIYAKAEEQLTLE